jgi:hypothetical protein
MAPSENEHAVDDNTAIGTSTPSPSPARLITASAVALMLGDLNPIGSIDHDPRHPRRASPTLRS